MKIHAQQDKNIIEMKLFSFNHASHAEIRQEISVKSKNDEMMKQRNKYVVKDNMKIDLNVPNSCKHIIQIIEQNINESEMLPSVTMNRNNSEVLNSKTKNTFRIEWYEKESVSPIKNGLYYVSDGVSVKISFFDKRKRSLYMLKELDVLYWSPTTVTLLQ